MASFISVSIETRQFLSLVSQLSKLGSTEDPVAVIRKAIDYWMDNVEWKREDLMPDPMGSEGKGYTWKHLDSNLFLPHGTDIRMRYKDKYYYAKVEGDEILYNGDSVSPASLVNSITKSSRNAWRDLWILKPGMKEWVLADNSRTKACKED
jgi:hypothetical protein